MQDSFEVMTSEGSYPVMIGNGIIREIASKHPDAIYLVDKKLLKHIVLPSVHCIELDATEENKSLERMTDVVSQLRKLGANRDSHLVAVGGGIIQDIVTFCASLYMRGLAWTYVPSTMLSMADSCVGGKSSINVASYKNLVGNIYPPSAVYVDVALVATLPTEHVIGGLFEAAKICYAHSISAMREFSKYHPSPSMDLMDFHKVVYHALICKKWFIEIDEFDQKERMLLNFGHTFGHALEAGTNYRIPHGVAIGIGMLVAVCFSRQREDFTDVGAARVNQLSDYVKSTIWNNRRHILCLSESVQLHLVMEKFENDKKHLSSYYRMIVPNLDGNLELVSFEKNEKSRVAILDAFHVTFIDISCFSFN